MNQRTTLLAAGIAATLASAVIPNAVNAAELRTAQLPIPGRYIVVLKDQSAALANETQALRSRPSVEQKGQEVAGRHNARMLKSYKQALRGMVVEADDKALAQLLADPDVAFVEEDGVVRASGTQTGATWGIDRIDQRALPLNSTYNYDTTASTVHAYIIDTGLLSTHSEFSGRVGNGYSAVTDGKGTTDCNGHGTHVTGTVAGTTYGIAKQAKVHPVRVLGCDGSGSNSGVIAGMDWVAQNHIKPAVANMSLGGGVSSATDAAIATMVNAGVTVAVAAGNDNDNACNYSPARAPSAITVGSTTNTDARSSFSNYGTCVDIFAPGSNILSAWMSGGTNTISGTSMASPHVAGVAALYLANNPSATPAQVTSALITNSTPNKVTSPGTGSPNRLLYSLFSGGGGGGGGGGGTLQNGVAVSVTGAAGSQTAYTINVPSGSTNLVISTTGGTGDADLYVKFGSAPTTSSYDCRPYRSGNEESCTIAAPKTGTYYVMVNAYSAYTTSLKGSFTASGGGGGGGSRQTYSNATDYTIDDRATVDSPIAVSGRTGNGPTDAKVTVDIVHTYRGDLKVDLVAPDGSLYNISNYSGGSADNITGTTTLNLSSEAINGSWKLRVLDNYTGDTGYINSWSLDF